MASDKPKEYVLSVSEMEQWLSLAFGCNTCGLKMSRAPTSRAGLRMNHMHVRPADSTLPSNDFTFLECGHTYCPAHLKRCNLARDVIPQLWICPCWDRLFTYNVKPQTAYRIRGFEVGQYDQNLPMNGLKRIVANVAFEENHLGFPMPLATKRIVAKFASFMQARSFPGTRTPKRKLHDELGAIEQRNCVNPFPVQHAPVRATKTSKTEHSFFNNPFRPGDLLPLGPDGEHFFEANPQYKLAGPPIAKHQTPSVSPFYPYPNRKIEAQWSPSSPCLPVSSTHFDRKQEVRRPSFHSLHNVSAGGELSTKEFSTEHESLGSQNKRRDLALNGALSLPYPGALSFPSIRSDIGSPFHHRPSLEERMALPQSHPSDQSLGRAQSSPIHPPNFPRFRDTVTAVLMEETQEQMKQALPTNDELERKCLTQVRLMHLPMAQALPAQEQTRYLVDRENERAGISARPASDLHEDADYYNDSPAETAGNIEAEASDNGSSGSDSATLLGSRGSSTEDGCSTEDECTADEFCRNCQRIMSMSQSLPLPLSPADILATPCHAVSVDHDHNNAIDNNVDNDNNDNNMTAGKQRSPEEEKVMYQQDDEDAEDEQEDDEEHEQEEVYGSNNNHSNNAKDEKSEDLRARIDVWLRLL